MKRFIKCFALAVLVSCQFAVNVRAAIVSYQFSGIVSFVNNPSNAMPAGIDYNVPFTGSFTYDTTANVNGVDFDPASTNSGDFYFSTNGGFSMSFNIAGHTFANVKHATNYNYASFVVQNDYYGADTLSMNDGLPNIFMDGGAFPGNPDTAGLFMNFQDPTATALNSDAMPLSAPKLSSFFVHRMEVDTYKNGKVFYVFQGDITNIVQILPPSLSIHSQPNKTVLLSWPLVAQGYNLEQNTNLNAGIGWQPNPAKVVDTATDHTITLPASGSMYFRLKTP